MFGEKHVKTCKNRKKSWIGAKNIFFAPLATNNVARCQEKIPKRLGSMQADIMKVDPINEIVDKYNPNLQRKLKKSC